MSEWMDSLIRRVRGGLVTAAVAIGIGLLGSKLTSGLFWGPSARTWLGAIAAFSLVAALGLITRTAYIPQLFEKVRIRDDEKTVKRRADITWQVIIAAPIILWVWLMTPGLK